MGLFQRDPIAPLLKESGRWVIVSKEGSDYRIRNKDRRQSVYIYVVRRPGAYSTLFQAHFPVQFSLTHEPKGLFARVLLRNLNLMYGAAWSMYIGGSAEACLTLIARVPNAVLSATRLDVTCEEIVEEMIAFHRELHDKVSYEAELPYGYGNRKPLVTERNIESERFIAVPKPPMRYQLPGK
jgi:hypothetical protein